MDKTFIGSTEGYTFIELLVAITILGFVVAPFLNLFTNSFSSIALAGQQSCAINLCREKMESVKALGYTQVYEFYITENRSPFVEDFLPANPGFWRVTEISQLLVNAAGTPQIKLDLIHIKITVYWMVQDKEYSEAVESYLARQ